jgi:hypothetical protein
MIVGSVLALAVLAQPIQVVGMHFRVSDIYRQRPESFEKAAQQGLAAGGIAVITPEQADQQLGARRQELLGCGVQEPGCAAALGEALAVQGILRGAIARQRSLGGYQVSLEVIGTADGRPLATFYEGGVDEGRLAAVLTEGAGLLARDLAAGELGRLAASPAVHASVTSPKQRRVGWGALALLVATTAVGVGAAVHRMEVLAEPRPASGTAPFGDYGGGTDEAAETSRVLSVVMFSIAGVAMVTSAVMLALGFHHTPVTLAPLPGGVQLGLGGTF